MSCVTSVDPHWLADLGSVFYSVKEKAYSAKDRRVIEMEFNRKAELEAQMAEEEKREAQRIAEEENRMKPVLKKKPVATAGRRVANGTVKRPLTSRIGRGF